MIKIGDYMFRGEKIYPKCDSCQKNSATHKVYTEDKNKEYVIGIRFCDECLEELKDKLKSKLK